LSTGELSERLSQRSGKEDSRDAPSFCRKWVSIEWVLAKCVLLGIFECLLTLLLLSALGSDRLVLGSEQEQSEIVR
jgi:hypothetical protein